VGFLNHVYLRVYTYINIVTISGCDCKRGLGWWIGFINHLYTQSGTTSNYSAIAYLHTLQITTAHAKSFFQPAVSSTAVPWQRYLKMEILQLSALAYYCPAIEYLSTVNSTVAPSLQSSTQLPTLNWTHFTSLHFTSLHFTSLHFTSLHFTSLHFTSLHPTELHSSALGSSLYSLGADPTKMPFFYCCARSFPRKRVYLAVA
jgi:hypothetical protein